MLDFVAGAHKFLKLDGRHPRMDMQPYLRKRRVPHKVTPIGADKSSRRKNHKLSESHLLAKQIAREVSGLMPYEKKAIDIIKMDNLRKARKFLKRRLGSMQRAEKKFEDLFEKSR